MHIIKYDKFLNIFVTNNMRIIIFITVIYFRRFSALLYPLVDLHSLYKYIPPENEVSFHFVHQNVARICYMQIKDYYSLNLIPFDAKLQTIIIIHGWTHGKDTPWVREMAEALEITGYWNVFVVDWSKLSHVPYVEARIHNLVVAKQLKKFLFALETTKGYSMDKIHIVGHSMGAQIASSAAHAILNERGGKIGRITGLDPAGPLYEWPHIESKDELLDPSDAYFVDIIHTNSKHIGTVIPTGHIDYYVNGGQKQWGCTKWSCSHIRACELFIASIRRPDLFKAFSYESWIKYKNKTTKDLEVYPMGISAGSYIPQGIYFVQVKDEYKEYVLTKTNFVDSFGVYYGKNQLAM
ncbi:unnamed protein product [Phyllotreta striolata]|uniref:Lipase domain-containing protein n=1 Tax=Phyllotreta striolata TaxID=444603 RepID=A0A9N9TGA6_PHYSR|nr:unnamed protein product [Phyllotreta striolata]